MEPGSARGLAAAFFSTINYWDRAKRGTVPIADIRPGESNIDQKRSRDERIDLSRRRQVISDAATNGRLMQAAERRRASDPNGRPLTSPSAMKSGPATGAGPPTSEYSVNAIGLGDTGRSARPPRTQDLEQVGADVKVLCHYAEASGIAILTLASQCRLRQAEKQEFRSLSG